MNQYDAIVIGAGHNGLVAAAYLAKAGKKVLVLERRPIIGGAAVTEEIYPKFKYSSGAYVCGLFHPRIIRELKLPVFGFELIPYDPVRFTPTPDGTHLLVWREIKKSLEEIEKFSKADAANYLPFAARVKKLGGFLRSLMLKMPPQVAGNSPLELWELLKLGLRFRGLGAPEMRQTLRVFPMSVADFLSEWFESEPLRASLATSGILGTFLPPCAQGTAYIFLHHHLGESEGPFRAWGFVRGGMGNLPQAVAAAARRHGAEIRTNAEVAQVLVKNGTASGVILRNGDEILATVVLSGADLKRTFLTLVEPSHLEPHFRLQVRNVRFRGACAKINLALAELPRFRGFNGCGPFPHHHGLIQIAPSIDYLEKAFDDAKYGGFSRRPFLEIAIPSVSDPTLAPTGKHVMSVLLQYAPYDLKEGSWRDQREALGDLAVNTINEYAPGFKDSILHRQVLTPLDLEETYGLTEGNIHHGELSLDQLFFMRPIPGWSRYRTPIRNLYLCSASTHPGGGITGAPGYNAAREVLKDWRRRGRGPSGF
ncbi:MAG: hypothetical protein A2038_03045 [Deltaproteobacteria bacterium GWA2_57_13]|nr:MAG: hypothetical protein A2038_03045 [Deltaproteobacteria bacterium GWA2_57_13]